MEKTNKLLVEKWTPLIESKKAKSVKNPDAMAQLLENQESWCLNEATTTVADVAQYTPILVPAVRRIFPNLIANEIVGVQPLAGPTGYAYALRYAYEGAGGKLNKTGEHSYPTGARGVQKNTQAFGGAAIVLSGNVPFVIGGDFDIDADGAGVGAAVKWGTVAYAEYNAGQGVTKVLINITKSGETSVTLKTALALGAGIDCGTAGADKILGTDTSILAFLDNEAGYNLIFTSGYAPYGTTAAQEYEARANMKSMKMGIERFAVEAQTRKLKAEYSIELAQDLKAVHGLDAEAELINIIEYEISAELDRELVEAIHANCTNASTWSYGTAGVISNTNGATSLTSGTADGRNEMEKFRTLYSRIVREANAVAISTRRGAANFIIASLNVVSALETLPNFMYSQVPGSVEAQFGVAKVGTLDGKFTVYLDTFAYSDFFIVGYKGPSAFDTGIVYCPYVPLQIQKVIDPSTFQPLVGFMTRDAIVGNLWGAEKYYRKVTCNFAGSNFISGNYYQ